MWAESLALGTVIAQRNIRQTVELLVLLQKSSLKGRILASNSYPLPPKLFLRNKAKTHPTSSLAAGPVSTDWRHRGRGGEGADCWVYTQATEAGHPAGLQSAGGVPLCAPLLLPPGLCSQRHRGPYRPPPYHRL